MKGNKGLTPDVSGPTLQGSHCGHCGLWLLFRQWPLFGVRQAAAVASISNSEPGMASRVTPSNVIGGATL